MQLPTSPDPETLPSIEAALQRERVERYMPVAFGDDAMAFRFYLWNCALCEAFFISLHFAEIVCRNAMNRALMSRSGPQWYDNATLQMLLQDRFRVELAEAVRKERQQHGGSLTSHHVVSALTFGFWEHLATKRFERFLWARGIHSAFPGAPANKTYSDLHDLIESVRRWRNRIAHHRAVFDKGPMRKHQDALQLIKWACGYTGAWVASVSKVPGAIALRPDRV